jgi:hypothetical protein
MPVGAQNQALVWITALSLVSVATPALAAAPAENDAEAPETSQDQPSGEQDAPEEEAAEEAEELSAEGKRAQQLFFDGSAQFSAADYTGAIEKFTEALKIVTKEGLDPTIRGALLINLARAHRKAYDVSRDLTHLRSSLEIYSRITREAERGGYSEDDVQEATEGYAEIEAQLAQIEDDEKKSSAPSAATAPSSDPSSQEDGSSKRTLGIALAATGGVLLAGGAGALGWGTTFKGYAEDTVADSGEEGFESADEHIAQQEKAGVTWMAAGGAAAAVGLAGLITGVVIIVKDGKARKNARLSFSPIASRQSTGVMISGRF